MTIVREPTVKKRTVRKRISQQRIDPERRSGSRLRALQYTALWWRQGPLRRLRPRREAAVLDFNRHGICLRGESPLKAGERIELLLRSNTECIKGIRGTVRHVERNDHEFCCGIEFELTSAPAQLAGGQNALACVESLIESRLL